MDRLITLEVCDNYETAQEFMEQYKEMKESWNKINQSLHQLLEESKEKVRIITCNNKTTIYMYML